MKYQLFISDKANGQIKNHIIFVSNVSKEAGKKLNQEFQHSIKTIAKDPAIYPFFDGQYIPYSKYHKYVVTKRYIILYQIINDTVYVDYVIDTRTDYQWLVR